MPVAVVVLAAGAGQRSRATSNKVLLPLLGVPVVAWSVLTALAVPDVVRVLVVVRAGEQEALADALVPHLGDREVRVVVGGATRHDSEAAGLAALVEDVDGGAVDLVVIHDAARPLAGADLYAAVVHGARAHGAAIPVVEVADLLGPDGVEGDVGAVQTPQAFRARQLLAAFDDAEAAGFAGTDTAATWRRFAGAPVAAVPSTSTNLKITWPGDLDLAARLATAPPTLIR